MENIWKDRIWNKEIYLDIGVAPIDEKMRESHLKWFDYVQRRANKEPVRKKQIDPSWRNEKNRKNLKIILVEVIKLIR